MPRFVNPAITFCDVSELRNIYKYDMLHNAILLVALASAAVSI